MGGILVANHSQLFIEQQLAVVQGDLADVAIEALALLAHACGHAVAAPQHQPHTGNHHCCNAL